MKRAVGNIGGRAVALLAGVALLSGTAFGAGFQIVEQSVSGLGNAFAGGAASAEDVTTVYFNPAGLTLLKGQHADVGVHVIVPSAQFDNDGSSHALQGITGQGMTGDNGGEGGETGFVPNAYYAISLDSGLAFGLGVNAPFGLATDYNDDWVGRYHATRSDLKTININPAVAYKVTDKLSLGAGFDVQYVKADLRSAIDFGTILVAAGGIPQQQDGDVKLEADNWGYGFNVGFLYEFTPNTRLGAHYRSRINHGVNGDADFSMSAQVRATIDALIAAGSAVPTFTDTDASADITLPDTASLSLYHRYSPKFAVMADISWTNWSVFDELKVKFDDPTQPDSITTEDWKDSWKYAVGATYSPKPALDLRCGLAYDTTPIPDAEHRTPRIPGESRFWVALGGGYRFTDHFKVDLGYAHLFVKDSEIDKDPVGEDALRGGLKGTYDNSVNIFSAQAVINW